MRLSATTRALLVVVLAACAVLAGGATRIVQDQCSPFADVTPGFCPYILEVYHLGITAGTSPTTYSPNDPLTRGQAAVFIAKGVNQTLARSSRRAALGQWWAPSYFPWRQGLGVTSLPDPLGSLVCDGSDVWVGGSGGNVFRVRASDGKLLETWTIGKGASALLVAMGRIFIVGETSGPDPDSLFMIDPAAPAGAATEVAALPSFSVGLAFDGNQFWTASQAGSVSIITPASTTPWSVTTVSSGFQAPTGIVFDGQNNWVSDIGACSLFRLDSSAAIQQAIPLGSSNCGLGPPAFDGTNVLVPARDSLQVVRASDGALAATIPIGAEKVAFDGERILVERSGGGQNAPRGLTLLRAADFTTIRTEEFDPIGGPSVSSLAADGVNFWVTFQTGNGDVLARY